MRLQVTVVELDRHAVERPLGVAPVLLLLVVVGQLGAHKAAHPFLEFGRGRERFCRLIGGGRRLTCGGTRKAAVATGADANRVLCVQPIQNLDFEATDPQQKTTPPMPAGQERFRTDCRLSLRERTPFRGAKGDKLAGQRFARLCPAHISSECPRPSVPCQTWPPRRSAHEIAGLWHRLPGRFAADRLGDDRPGKGLGRLLGAVESQDLVLAVIDRGDVRPLAQDNS